MADIALEPRTPSGRSARPPAWDQLKANRNWLGFWFMLPAMAFLILFLAYPLGLGVWISFTDARSAAPASSSASRITSGCGTTSIFWLSVFNTLLYTSVASAIKFAIGLYLALLLNENMPFKAMMRALVLIPFIVPTVLSALAFWWIFDSQFSIISWSLKQLGLITENINFLGDVDLGADLRDLRQHLARRSVRRDHAAGRACRRCRPRCTRPRRSTAPRAGRCSATSPIRC